jgi:hypothetical protein
VKTGAFFVCADKSVTEMFGTWNQVEERLVRVYRGKINRDGWKYLAWELTDKIFSSVYVSCIMWIAVSVGDIFYVPFIKTRSSKRIF